MGIQIAVYILLIVFYIIFNKNINRNRKWYIIACSLVIMLKIALRSVTIGSDTVHYAYYFYESMETPWSELLSAFSTRYESIAGDIDYGYYVLQKVFSTFITDFNLFTFCIQGLFFFLPLGILIYRNSNSQLQVLFAYTLLNALFLGLPMANARQVYAIGLCICSFIFLLEKKYIMTAIFIILGFLIHASALIFALPVALSFVGTKSLKTISIVALILFFFVLNYTNEIILFMANFIGMDKYTSYGEGEIRGGATTYIVLSLLLCMFCLYGFFKAKMLPDRIKKWFVMLPLTTFFVPLIYSNGSMMRITLYFQIYFLLLIPFTIDILYKKRDQKIIYFALIAILIFMSVSSSIEYKFFWEESQDTIMYWK